MKPEPSPADTLRKVIRIAKVNGMIVVFPTSCLCGLVAALFGDWRSALIGFLVAAAGWSEWHGAKLLKRGEARGIGWLVRSQLYLLGLILLYALWQMASYNPALVRSLITPDMAQTYESAGVDIQDVVRIAYYALYGTLAVLTLFYQGGLALFYRRRTAVVQAALAGGNAIAASGPAGQL
ncbi:MAG TPA: hypothetical protein VK785_07550 [Opitutaceae bacterium]|jgi:hypothetical protein|nr:hypothetical protein [Opitutaceae bacterium]